MNTINYLIIQIAVIILILSLIVIAIVFFINNREQQFPPYTTDCPDKYYIDTDGMCNLYTDYYDSANSSKYIKSLESCKINSNSWLGLNKEQKFCKKYNAVKNCPGVFWDGITNANREDIIKCSTVFDF